MVMGMLLPQRLADGLKIINITARTRLVMEKHASLEVKTCRLRDRMKAVALSL